MNTRTSAELIDAIGAVEKNPPTSPIGVKLSEGADKVLDASSKSINQIFDYAMERLTKVRHSVDLAEEAVKNKREAVVEALESYVESLQMVETSTADMQRLIGDVLIASDRLGGT